MSDLINTDHLIVQLEQMTLDQRTKSAASLVAAIIESDLSASPDLYLASVLRIVAIDYDLIYSDVKNRQRVLNLVIEQIEVKARQVFNKLGINKRTQADEACRRISSIVPSTLAELQGTLQSYDGTDTLSILQNRLPRFLNQPSTRISIRPFFRLNANELTQCIGKAISYIRCDDPRQVREAYDDAQRAVRTAHEEHDGEFTCYEQMVIDLLSIIGSDLEEHFKSSPHGKPADLEIRSRSRRYPLHHPKRDISIPIELRNNGEGLAIDVAIEIVDSIDIDGFEEPIRVPSMEPGSMLVEANARTIEDPPRKNQALCVFRILWMNADGGARERGGFEVLLEPQDPDIDWPGLLHTNPYSLEAVMHKEQLIGRQQIVSRIVGTLNTDEIGSLYLHGEKRVGKTSLAHVVLEEMSKIGVKGVFRDIGAITHSDPERAIDNLTTRLATAIAKHVPALSAQAGNIRCDGSLASLNEFLETVADLGTRLVIALDEFDQLPPQLFGRNASADAFFAGLRAISTIRGVGLMLIAGERMKLIINGAGVYLNRFASFPVDYIDRENHWADFEELVRKPSEGHLEFGTDAISRICEFTAGNPYYTKQICAILLEIAADRRDAHIDTRLVDVALELLLSRIDQSSFSHYWEDFILDDDEKRRDDVSLNRRRFLLAVGLASTSDTESHVESVIRHASKLGLDASATRRELDGFLSRGLFSIKNDTIRPRIRLFGRWIRSVGHDQIVLSAPEREASRAAISERRRFHISPAQADELVERWGVYNGRAVTGDRLLDYLSQFGDVRNQWLIYCLLKGIHFIDTAEEVGLLKEAYNHLSLRMGSRYTRWNRDQIRISYTGATGKSGNAMARSFAGANRFVRDTRGIVAPRSLRKWERDKGVTDVVFVEDFVGTGDSLCQHLRDIGGSVSDSQNVHVFVLAGTCSGIDKADGTASEVFGRERAEVRALIEIRDDVQPFSVDSGLFASVDDSVDAEKIITDVGSSPHRSPRGSAGLILVPS